MIISSIALCVLLPLVAAADNEPKSCFLLGGAVSEQPFPSLSQCYKHNGPDGACCVSAQDSAIGGDYGGLFSESCSREYPMLANYYCLGCDPLADTYIRWYNANKSKYMGPNTVSTTKATDAEGRATRSSPYDKTEGKFGDIRICTSFAYQLMFASGSASPRTAPLDKYDKCGIQLESEGGSDLLSSEYFVDPVPIPFEADALCTDSPRTTCVNDVPRTKEFKFFNELRPTSYGTADFDIRWMEGASPLTQDCFGAAPASGVAGVVAVLVALVAAHLA